MRRLSVCHGHPHANAAREPGWSARWSNEETIWSPTIGTAPTRPTCSLTDGNWTAVPTSGYEPWATARAAIWDGTRLRIFAAKSPFPNFTYQITYDNTAWDGWSVIFSQGQATLQPTATIMNGDVDLVTYWYTLGMFDQFVK